MTETKNKGKRRKRNYKSYWLYWSWIGEGKRVKGAVVAIVVLNGLKDIMEEEYVNEPILVVKIKLDDEETWTC